MKFRPILKRTLAGILAVSLMLSTGFLLLPLVAEGGDVDTDVNFAANIHWDKKIGTPTVVQTASGAVMSNLSNSWDSAGVNILPALKQALGEEDRISIALSVDVTATMKSGFEGSILSARILMRGTDTKGNLGDNAWNEQYAGFLGGDFSLFEKYGGNVMAYLDSSLSLKHGETITYKTTLDLTRKQLECEMLSEWVLCVDNLGGMNMSGCENVEFKNLMITKVEKAPVPDDDNGNADHLVTDYMAETWSPVEITLGSTVNYSNPDVDTQIDAVFTHTDGTKITLPGFWKEGSTWAVRFSPTKVGEWTYSVTCADKSNTGLFKGGKITATEGKNGTELSKHGFVTIEKGKHYYQHADGTPFFWLGDTNWQAFSHVSTTVCNYPGCNCGNQFKHIVDDRKAKGFNVYQTYFVAEAGNGEPSVWRNNQHKYPATDVYNEKIDYMFEYLHEQGMTVALGLGCHTQTPSGMNLDDFLRFTRYIVARYACYSVVWISGQEINIEGQGKTPGYSSFDYYMNASALIEELDGYNHPNSAHMYPITADHADGVRLDKAPWHDSWTVQGGHCMVRPKSYYESYYVANNAGYAKPFIESEANYEDINCGGFTGYDLNRMSAWVAMLCGSAGFTYGTTGIWANCFSTSVFTGWYGATTSFSYEPWYMGLDKPGSFEMTYMKQFFMDIGNWNELIPCFSDRDIASTLRLDTVTMSATEDASIIVAYFYAKHRSCTIKILDPQKTYDAYWFNPRTGKYISIAKNIRAEDGTYTVDSRPDTNDWVFLLTAVGLADHYEENLPKDLNPTYAQVAPTGTKVTPVSVKAVGGISYSGNQKDSQTMTDHTKWLWDGDPSTVWTPVANRTTQTFLFDLGKAQKLTHVTITPATGTIIPTFRVEGSNDGKIWTVITDTSTRDVKNPGTGSEPLEGTYRYVKILLRNADSVNIGENKLDTLPYKAMYNPMSWNCYSVTEIADIAIYSDGEGTPTPDKLVTREEGDGSTEDTDVVTDDTVTDAPATGTDASDTVTEPAPATGCRSVVLHSVSCIIACAAFVLMKKKRT